ncbi:unnamed protein product [Schistocephalus solidus]|uniref:Tensin n=1 Tax=Schistocephalus solidus TaxID=70667 RepID=A0A183SB54_SCHSO|nr:unnamed protein product [Schistocephalus solidus]
MLLHDTATRGSAHQWVLQSSLCGFCKMNSRELHVSKSIVSNCYEWFKHLMALLDSVLKAFREDFIAGFTQASFMFFQVCNFSDEGKNVKNGQAIRERSSSNSISCSHTDARHSVSSGFMDLPPETSLLTVSDSEHERVRSSPLPPTSYTGQCSCVPPPPYTPQDSHLLPTIPDPDQFSRFGGARSHSCSSASTQQIDQLKEEFDQALADICYHSETYSSYTGLPEYSNTGLPPQHQTTQHETVNFPQLRSYGFDSRSQKHQPLPQLMQSFASADIDYPQTCSYFTQGYPCADTFQQPFDIASPASEQHRSAFRPYEICPSSVQTRTLAPTTPVDTPICFRQSSRARSPSRISPQAAALTPVQRKRNSWDWQWTETSGCLGEGLRRHSSRSSVHSEIAGPSYMSSTPSSAVAAAIWRSRRLRGQHVGDEDNRQTSVCQNSVLATRPVVPGALSHGCAAGRTTTTQYLPMRSAVSAASLDKAVLPQVGFCRLFF